MSEGSKLDPKAEGFRDLPELLTGPGMLYIARIIEIRDLFSFFFHIFRSLGEIAKRFPEGTPDDLEFKRVSVEIPEHQRQAINEIYLTRAVETFDLYVLTMLREVFCACPDMLKSEGSIEAAAVLEFKTIEELIFHIAERRLHDLAFKPLSELAKYINTRLGIDLFKSDLIYKKILLATEVRNLIAHNDCIVNRTFLRRIGPATEDLKVGEGKKFRLTDEWLRRTVYSIDGVVFDFDDATTKKFGLSRQNPRATVIDRLSATSVTFAVARNNSESPPNG